MSKTTILLFLTIFSIATASYLNHLLPLRQKDLLRRQSTTLASDGITPKANVQLNRIAQNIDNFNPQNTDQFQQKYYRTEDYYKPGGPIFILIGGQYSLNDINNFDYYLINDIAKSTNGLLFYLEHRYYGESLPFEQLTTENLRYLTVDQALADISHFVDHVQQTYVSSSANSSDVYLVGSLYSGGLAVWFRQRYPHLAAGAWASSASVVARVDNYEFNEIAGDVYRKIGGNQCYEVIEKGFQQIDKLIEDNRTAELSKMFGVCNDVNSDKRDLRIFLSTLNQLFGYMINGNVYQTVSATCESLRNTTASFSEIEALAEFFIYFMHLEEEFTCINVSFSQIMGTFTDTDPTSDGIKYGFRQYMWQECSQLGWFPTSNSDRQPFGDNVKIQVFYDICEVAFGLPEETINRNAERFNVHNAGLNPEVTKVLFTHGEFDPFRSIGVQSELNAETPLIVIPGFATSADMAWLSGYDAPAVQIAKQTVQAILTDWVNNKS